MTDTADLDTAADSIHHRETGVPQSLSQHFGRFADRSGPTENHSLLADIVRTVALPRLLATHKARTSRINPEQSIIEESDRELLLAQVISPDYHLTEATLTVLALRGATRADIVQNLFAPVARRLNLLWLDDRLTIADVTLGICALQRFLRSPALPRPVEHPGRQGASILVAALPGDAHPFEAAVIEDQFRCAQWETERLVRASDDILSEAIGAKRYDMLVLSVSCQSGVARLGMLIRHLRKASTNPQLLVMVTAFGVETNTLSIGLTGADAIAKNASFAVESANNLLQSTLRKHWQQS